MNYTNSNKSAFSPLNLAKETSKKDLEENLTREIEIENAFKEFEEAITLQKAKNYTAAYAKYKELARRDVVNNHYYEEFDFIKGLQNGRHNAQLDELSLLSQNEKTIRFLYFRNRGFLYFNILKAGDTEVHNAYREDEISKGPDFTETSIFEFSKSLFYSMLDDFCNCFVYLEPDESLIELLYDIYLYFDLRRLARYTLEYVASSPSETDDVTSILPISEKLNLVWMSFKKNCSKSSELTTSALGHLSFLDGIKEDLCNHMRKSLEKSTVLVLIKPGTSWTDFLQSFNSAIKQNQNKSKAAEYAKIYLKHLDPYITTERPLEEVLYSLKEFQEAEEVKSVIDSESNDTNLLQDTKTIQIEELKLKEEAPIQETTQPIPQNHSTEKTIQRFSRRLNPGDLFPIQPDNVQLSRNYFVETETFFNLLNGQFSQIFNIDTPILRDVVDYIVDYPTKSDHPIYVVDFVNALNDWKKKIYDPLVFPKTVSAANRGFDADNDKLRLLDVLTRFGNQNACEENEHILPIEEVENHNFIESLFAKEKENPQHYFRTKTEILEHLLSHNGHNLVIETKWPRELFLIVRDWVFQQELELYKNWSVPTGNKVKWQLNFSFAVSIFEILIDSYIETKTQVEVIVDSGSHLNSFKSPKSNLNLLSIELVRLKNRIECWKELILDAFTDRNPLEFSSGLSLQSIARFGWATSYFIASYSFDWKQKKYVVMHLKELEDFLKNSGVEYPRMSFPNYHHIGTFNEDSMNRRLNTTSILSIFSKILYNNGSKNDEDQETIELLELILIDENPSKTIHGSESVTGNSLVDSVVHGRATLDRESLKSVRDFLTDCPIDLKLSLWNILFLYYKGKKLFTGFQKGFEQTLEFVLQFWNSEKYKDHKTERVSLLLNSLSFYGNYSLAFLRHLADNKWELPISNSDTKTKVIENLCRIFELSYTFSLHEEGSLITGNKISLSTVSENVYSRFKDFCVESICLVLVYSINRIENSDIAQKGRMIKDLLISVHGQFGLRRLCDASHGLFLRFAEDTLVKLNDRPDQELAQLLSCRFHYKVKIQGTFPVDHYTEECGKLDKSSAEELAAFILPLCFRHSPLLRAPRNDTKQVIDDLYEVIGDADIESDPGLVENNITLEKYLDVTVIDSRFIKGAFYGLHKLRFVKPQIEGKLVHGGIYYLEAILMFNFYKIRKKSAQSRTVELERIIRLLQDDLIFGTERIESWIILGQAYGFIVEDDLIWTSDKLNAIDRKAQTANIQRKSLLCYMMAVNMIAQQPDFGKDDKKHIVGVLMNSLVKEFYGASRSPMDMMALKAYVSPKFVRRRNQSMFLAVSDKPNVPLKFCLKLMLRCVLLAIKSNEKEWSSYYYLAKIKDKLKHDPKQVLDALVSASTYSKELSVSSDPSLEATYKLCDLVYKYVKSDKIDVEMAVSYINKDVAIQMNANGDSWTKRDVYNLIIDSLKKIIVLDKKGWYHKPHYRMSYILCEDFKDFKRAKDVMSKFFFLKASNKSFLQMWKPENERPGKHFVYMYQYTQFYISLLKNDKDVSSLTQMLPKLRRANSTMILLYFAWEKICSATCELVRSALDIKNNSVEKFIVQTPHPIFVSKAKFVADTVKAQEMSYNIKGLISLLSVINDMKRLNNGFGPTSQVDDTLCAIYVLIFSLVKTAESLDVQLSSPGGTKTKRIAKKDFFPFINDLVSKSKRDIDSLLKDDSDVLNEFVEHFTEEKRKKLEHEQELLQEEKSAREAQLLREAQIANEQMQLNEARGVNETYSNQNFAIVGQAQLSQTLGLSLRVDAAKDLDIVRPKEGSQEVKKPYISKVQHSPCVKLRDEGSDQARATSQNQTSPTVFSQVDAVHKCGLPYEHLHMQPSKSPITSLIDTRDEPSGPSQVLSPLWLFNGSSASPSTKELGPLIEKSVAISQSSTDPVSLNCEGDQILNQGPEISTVANPLNSKFFGNLPISSIASGNESRSKSLESIATKVISDGGLDFVGEKPTIPIKSDSIFEETITEAPAQTDPCNPLKDPARELSSADHFVSEESKRLGAVNELETYRDDSQAHETKKKDVGSEGEFYVQEVGSQEIFDAKSSTNSIGPASSIPTFVENHSTESDPDWPNGTTVLGTEYQLERYLKRRNSATMGENKKSKST